MLLYWGLYSPRVSEWATGYTLWKIGEDFLESIFVSLGASLGSFLAERDLSADRQIERLYSEMTVCPSPFFGVFWLASIGTLVAVFSLF